MFVGVFFLLIWFGAFAASFGGYVLGIVAIISVLRLPTEAFGPWWDNTKSAWLIGIAVSFLVPCGVLVSGFLWFSSGKKVYNQTGLVGRPFWVGPPRPVPAGWHPDPYHRHELRFWDGVRWTDGVSDRGVVSQNPPNDQPH